MGIRKNRLLVIVFLLLSVAISGASKEKKKEKEIPPALHEMRAVWVATVANIDWPSKPGLSTEEQKKEAIVILDRIKELNLNAVILQVRPQADALYKSELEPWSYYLTGEQGKAPDSFYDPLEFWIEESHARGLELHAWFNPYRAGHSAMKGEYSPKSIVKAKPECVRKLGNQGYLWIDPAMKEGQDHSYAVIMDVLKRYDIDGIQFDDYFYPYLEYNDGKDFPDDESYQAYTAKGGKLSRGDWRRDAVNKFIERLYKGIKKEKPLVKFGISPFGVYRPGYPACFKAGFDQYATLYADAKLWLNKGWVDYYAPQLYWNISRMDLSYPLLLSWWNSENTKGRNIWPGLFIRPEIDRKEMSREIVNQVMVTRGMEANRPGTMLFSMKSLIPNDSLATGRALSRGPFASQALIPSYPWLDKKAPGSPVIKAEKSGGELKVSWTPSGKEMPFLYVLYTENDGKWTYEILPEKTLGITKKIEGTKISAVAVSAVDRCGNESNKNVFIVE